MKATGFSARRGPLWCDAAIGAEWNDVMGKAAVSTVLFVEGADLMSFWSEHSKKSKLVEDAVAFACTLYRHINLEWGRVEWNDVKGSWLFPHVSAFLFLEGVDLTS